MVTSIIYLIQHRKADGMQGKKKGHRRFRFLRKKGHDNDDFDDTTSTVASLFNNGDNDDRQSKLSKAPSWKLPKWTNRQLFHNPFAINKNKVVDTPSSTEMVSDTTPTTSEPYHPIQDDTNDGIFVLPIVDDGNVEEYRNINGYNDDDLDKDKDTTKASSSTLTFVEKFQKPRVENRNTIALLDNDDACFKPGIIGIDVEETMKRNDRAFDDVDLPAHTSTVQQQSMSPLSSILKKLASSRKRIKKLLKPKPSTLGKNKYIPPSLESIIAAAETGAAINENPLTSTSDAQNKLSFKVKDLMTDVDPFPNEARDSA